MNKREYAKLKKWTDTLTDEQLKEEYYDAVFDTLGSQAEEMYERGYDIADIEVNGNTPSEQEVLERLKMVMPNVHPTDQEIPVAIDWSRILK